MPAPVLKLAAQKNKSAPRKPGGKPGNVQAKENETKLVLHALEKNIAISPTLFDPSALSSSVHCDIPITAGLIGNVLGMTLTFTCTNNTNSNIVFLSFGAVDMIASIKELLEATRTPLVKHIKETLLFCMRYLSPDEIATYKRGFMPPSSGLLLPNASYTFYLPLLNDPLVINNVFLMSFREVITYRIMFQSNAWPGAVPSMSNFKLIARYSMPVNAQLADMRRMYASNLLEFPFYKYLEQHIASQVIAPGETITVPLTSFTGPLSNMMVYVRGAGSIVISNLSQLIDQYSILDSSDNSIMGLKNVDVAYHDSILSASHKNRSVVNASLPDPWIGINLSSDVKNDYLNGTVSGYHLFTGNEKLVLRFKSTLVAGAYVISVVQGKRYVLQVKGGEVNISI